MQGGISKTPCEAVSPAPHEAGARWTVAAGAGFSIDLFTAVSSRPEKNRYSVNMSRVNGEVDSGLEGQARINQGPLLTVGGKRLRKIAKSVIKMLYLATKS